MAGAGVKTRDRLAASASVAAGDLRVLVKPFAPWW